MKALQTLREALYATGVLQPVYAGEDGPRRVWVTCRLVPGQDAAWMALMEGLLRQWGGTEKGSDFVVARRFMLKDGAESPLVSGWYLSLQGKSKKHLEELLGRLLPVFEGARPSLAPAAANPPAFAAPAAANPPARRAVASEDDVYRDPEVELARAQVKGTDARPRPPDLSQPNVVPAAPPGFTPSINVVERRMDAKGQRHTVEEMPLPHVFKPMNMPKPDGKGRSVNLVG